MKNINKIQATLEKKISEDFNAHIALGTLNSKRHQKYIKASIEVLIQLEKLLNRRKNVLHELKGHTSAKGVQRYETLLLLDTVRTIKKKFNSIRGLAVDLEISGLNNFLSKFIIEEVLTRVKGNDTSEANYILEYKSFLPLIHNNISKLSEYGLSKDMISFLQKQWDRYPAEMPIRVYTPKDADTPKGKILIPDTGYEPDSNSASEPGPWGWENAPGNMGSGAGGSGGGTGGGGGGGFGSYIKVQKGLSFDILDQLDFTEELLDKIIETEWQFGLYDQMGNPFIDPDIKVSKEKVSDKDYTGAVVGCLAGVVSGYAGGGLGLVDAFSTAANCAVAAKGLAERIKEIWDYLTSDDPNSPGNSFVDP